MELGRGVTDQEVIETFRKQIKARKDAIEQFKVGGREDAAAAEEAEIAVLAAYLPKQMDEAETKAAIGALVAELGLEGKKDFGRLMKEIKARHPNIDGKLASQLAGAVLGG